MPTTRWPMRSTCASLESTPRSTEKQSCAVTARMPGTLFAAIATPRPVPQIEQRAVGLAGGDELGRRDRDLRVRGVAVGVDADVDDRGDARVAARGPS